MDFLHTLQDNWGTALWVLGGVILLAVIFKNLGPIRNFFREVAVELRKASWPWDPKEKGFKKYKELVDSTMIVVIAMLLLSGYVAFWDFMMLNVVSYLTGAK